MSSIFVQRFITPSPLNVLVGAFVDMSKLHVTYTRSLLPLLHGGRCVLTSSGLILCGSLV